MEPKTDHGQKLLKALDAAFTKAASERPKRPIHGPKCGNNGPFYKNKRFPDGLSYWCKTCVHPPKTRASNTARMREWRKTPDGRATTMWFGILTRVGNRDGRHPAYTHVELRMTRSEFINWVLPRLRKWFKSSTEVPTIDRRNNEGHYEIGNLRLRTRSQNALFRRANKNVFAPSGKAWCGLCHGYRPVEAFYKNKSTKHGLQFRCKEHS